MIRAPPVMDDKVVQLKITPIPPHTKELAFLSLLETAKALAPTPPSPEQHPNPRLPGSPGSDPRLWEVRFVEGHDFPLDVVKARTAKIQEDDCVKNTCTQRGK